MPAGMCSCPPSLFFFFFSLLGIESSASHTGKPCTTELHHQPLPARLWRKLFTPPLTAHLQGGLIKGKIFPDLKGQNLAQVEASCRTETLGLQND
jgi:hypothetical protein